MQFYCRQCPAETAATGQSSTNSGWCSHVVLLVSLHVQSCYTAVMKKRQASHKDQPNSKAAHLGATAGKQFVELGWGLWSPCMGRTTTNRGYSKLINH